MCGRYATGNISWAQYRERLNLTGEPTLNFEPRFNIAPTVAAPVAFHDGERRSLTMARWGIWKPWMEGKRLSTFNARDDRLRESRLFAPLVDTRRALVPALGFYEWTGPKGERQPHFIRDPDPDRMLVFAGLWDRAETDGAPLTSFTIITTAANDQMAAIHDRMPVILNEETQEAWMGREAAEALLRPWDAELRIDPVAPLKREDGAWQINPL